MKHLVSNKLINNTQYGFGHGRSTADILCLLTHQINQATNQYGEMHTIALDVSNIFYRVWHHSLLLKMLHYGLTSLVPLISSNFHKRNIRVLIDGLHSQFRSVNAGILQGSGLSPTLFLLLINDLLSVTLNLIHSFVDDSTLHSSFMFIVLTSTPIL